MKSVVTAITVLALCSAAVLLSGCNEVEMQSQWRSKPIGMDGSLAGWPEDVQYFDKNSRMLVSIMNDENTLYIRLVTRSETTKRMFFRAGFTLWIDDSGGSDKKFGIQFPLSRQSRMPGTMPDHKPRTGMEEKLADSQYNLAVLNGPNQKRQTMSVQRARDQDIYTGLYLRQNHLIYELKVPLPDSAESRILGIGFETGSLKRSSGQGGSGGGKGGGKGGGGGGGRGGGGRSGGGSGDSKGGQHGGGRPQAVEIWARVHLADKDVTSAYPEMALSPKLCVMLKK